MKKYKYLNYVPVPKNVHPNLYDLVDDEEFCKLDGRIPLLIATQYGIFSGGRNYGNESRNYSKLEGLEDNQYIGFIGKAYPTSREREGIFELFLETDTVDKIRRNEICIDLTLWSDKRT